MKRAFIDRKFHGPTERIIEDANRLIALYAEQGLTATVRQLYYQFIAQDLFPDTWIDEAYNRKNNLSPLTKNTQKNYKRLGHILSDARRAGWVDWDAIQDRTRWLRDVQTFDDPANLVETLARSYKEDLWALSQDKYVEVWIEKDALVGVIEQPCSELRVPYFPTRGYLSQSEAYTTGQRLRAKLDEGKEVIIMHLGDHDPSGMDMSRDLEERMFEYARTVNIDFRRLALTWEQVQQYNPPPNPAKETDSRFATYQQAFGDDSWELDALSTDVIQKLVRENIEANIEKESWDAAMAHEAHERRIFTELHARFPVVKRYLQTKIK